MNRNGRNCNHEEFNHERHVEPSDRRPRSDWSAVRKHERIFSCGSWLIPLILLAIAAVSLAACDLSTDINLTSKGSEVNGGSTSGGDSSGSGSSGGSGAPELSGTISISPDSGVKIGTELTAAYSGTETVSYRWNKDGTAITSGGTGRTYTPPAAGSYTVTVSATGYQSKTSDPVTVTAVPELSGTIIISPDSGVTTGTELTATYSGTETGITYQWNKDGTPLKVGRTCTPTTAGSYSVTLSAPGYQSKTSNPVTVTISELSGIISISPDSGVKAGIELTANYSGTEPSFTYQWNKDGAPITTGGTSRTYTPPTAGSYTVTVSAIGYQSKTSTAVIVASYTIGDTGPGGGKIFYASEAGFSSNGITCHYLEAAPVDQGTFTWASPAFYSPNQYKDIPGAAGTAIGTGAANTAAILAGDPAAPAALACKNYRGGGKADWFLPSKDELNELYVNKTTIGVDTNSHWSSSQGSRTGAWRQLLYNGIQGAVGKESDVLVRAIRAF